MLHMPLENIRVIDLTQVWAGPLASRVLADFGAEVIKVESIQRPDLTRYSHRPASPPNGKLYNQGGYFHQYNRNKYGITLNLAKSQGRDIFMQLVECSDVVVENYARRVIESFRLSYEELIRVKPDIIVLSLNGYGNTGPYRDGVAFGSTIEAVSGVKSLIGYGDGAPIYCGATIADPLSAMYGVFAVLGALAYRDETGKGQFIELSMHEAVDSIMEEATLEYTVGKHEPRQLGAHHPYFAPYGCYRCRNGDSWVTISVTSDEEWASLCKAVGNPALDAEKFSDPLSRWENRDELDNLISEWTTRHDKFEVMSDLQKAGVPAGACINGQDILQNPHLNERGYFWSVTCPDTGVYPQVGPAVKMSETPATLRLPPPALGEHNKYVLGELLGMSTEDIAALEKEKIIGNEPVY